MPVPNCIFLIPHTPFYSSCPLLTVYSSFLIPHSSFYIPHSSYPIPHSIFPIPHTPFLIPHNPFYSSCPFLNIFLIPHTPFLILYSPFLIPHILFFILLCLHSVPEDVDQVPLPVRNKSDQTTNKRGTSKETSEKGLSEKKGHLSVKDT